MATLDSRFYMLAKVLHIMLIIANVGGKYHTACSGCGGQQPPSTLGELEDSSFAVDDVADVPAGKMRGASS